MTAWLSVPEFAERLGVKPSHVRELLREGHLVATRTGPNNAVAIPADFLVEVPTGADAPGETGDEVEVGPTVEILPTLRGTLTVLSDAGLDDAAIIDWLLTADEELGMSPLAALREGRRAHVRRIAQTLV
jgi:excisionase family DNA binding protein